MTEWAIFNDESANYTQPESIEAGFYSEDEARAAIADRYSGEDDLIVHRVEEADDEDCDE